MASSKKKDPSQNALLEWQRSLQIEYLGWHQPILHAACDWIFRTYARGTNWDLNRVYIVLPGSLAGRRLQVLLAERASREKVVLRPSEILTLGKLPEKLYTAKLPFATDLEQIMAWTQVLRATKSEELQPLLLEVPRTDDLSPWMDLAKILSSLHRELASDLIDFADVVQQLSGTPEEPRWHVLAQLQRRYLDALSQSGLWDVQSARRFAIDHGEVLPMQHDVLLLGTVDMNRAQRRFLAAIAPNVKALIPAPASFADGFDADGTLRSEYWQDIEIPIPDAAIHVRGTVREAAAELAVQLAKLGSAYSFSQTTVGVPDPSLVPAFQETLARSGVTLRYGPGITIANTQPMRLLRAMEEFLMDGNIQSFHTLARSSLVYRWLFRTARVASADNTAQPLPEDFLALIDEFLNATLLRSVYVPEIPFARRGRPEFEAVVQALESWLEPFRSGKRWLSRWADPLRQVMATLYEGVVLEPETPEGNLVTRACREINAVIDQLTKLPSHLDVEVDWREAMAWLHQQLDSVTIPPTRTESSIEMVGWLELAFDDAPVLMLSGLHDGVVPESVNADAFLPNRLRSDLGLIDNARRYARDAFVMLTLLNTRERVEFVLNRLSSEGDPLTPSRLLMAVPVEQLAHRVRMLITESEPSDAVVRAWIPRMGQSNIPIPLPTKDKIVSDMAVTDFKKYNECPYRFYLNRVRGLRAVPHLPMELDGGAFGDLVHHVLEVFFTAPVANSSNANSVADWLVEALRKEARSRFGALPPPAVVVQLEQAVMRLQQFAIHHAKMMGDGWKMIEAECTIDREHAVPLKIDEQRTMKIHGRIDRIDRLERELAVWDYKTGDSSGEPRSIHIKGGKWADWQLPLYNLLVASKKYENVDSVRFGYILLPKNINETGFITAAFTKDEFQSAEDSAKELATRVMDGVFWPPSEAVHRDYDDYWAITQRTALRRWNPQIAQQEAMAEQAQKEHDGEQDSSDPTTSDEASDADIAVPTPRSRVVIGEPRKLTLEPVLITGETPDVWFSPVMILASAGTGKTYQLASRAIRLLFTNQPLDTILATTFTRKAAGEILYRVLDWLSAGCETESGFQRLVSILEPTKFTRNAVRYQLGRLCSQLHRFRVSTLDSFYSQLARSFALELKLPPGWGLLDTVQTEQLNREAISQMFETIEYQELRSLISQLSKGDAVRGVRTQIEEVVATAYPMYRQSPPEAWLRFDIPKGPEPSECDRALEVLDALSFDNKNLDKARAATITLFLEKNWEQLLKSTLVKACLDPKPMYSRKEIDEKLVAAIRPLARYAITAFLTSRRLQNEAAYQLLKRFDTTLRDLKQARRVVTFEDISERLAQWMTQRVSEARKTDSSRPMDGISHRMDCSIDHLLLDEFQDTSPAQWEIIKPFAEAIVESVPNSQKPTSFFVVGDSKQAIYAWRGGVSEIFESVGQQIRSVQSEKLANSRRSSPIVIDFVNDVFQRLALHPNYLSEDSSSSQSTRHVNVERWVEKYFDTHSTHLEGLPGYIECRTVRNIATEEGEEGSTGGSLFEDIAQHVAELHGRAPDVTIGILTRTNSDIARLIQLLKELGVEASQEGGNPLIDTAPVLVIMSALQLADHPGDRLAHFHVFHSPLAAHWDDDVRPYPHRVSEAIRHSLDHRGFGATISGMVEVLAPHCNWRDQQRLQQLVEEAYRFAAFRRSSIHDFLELLEGNRVGLPSASKVRIMTIHQSKGLEFDAVFLAMLDQDIVSKAPAYLVMRAERTAAPMGIMRYVPRDLQSYLDLPWQIAFRESADQQLGEALCLFYVALTRARQALYLIASPSKKPTKRWGSVLQTLFAQDKDQSRESQILFTAGDPNWFSVAQPASGSASQESGSQSEDAEAFASENVPAGVCKLRIALSHTLPTNTLPSHTSLSQSSPRIEGAESREAWMAPSRPVESQQLEAVELWSAEDTVGATIGKLVHRWFEEIRGWIDDSIPTKKQLLAIAAASLTQEEMSQVRVQDWIERFVGYCQLSSVRSALSEVRYQEWHRPTLLRLEVSTERRILQRMDDGLVVGIIDRCVLGYDGSRVVRAEIMDFKIDAKPGAMELESWVRDRVSVHARQLRAYGRVVCEQYQLAPESVQLTLVLLGANRLEPIILNGETAKSDATTFAKIL